MELRQLRYFVRIAELGSMGRAALDLDMVQSALSQQISRLESELSTRLLQRTAKGAVPTEAGLAFFREAQLALRHADQAARAAAQGRLTGSVSVGLSPTTASVLGVPLMRAMHARYPDAAQRFVLAEISDAPAFRPAALCSLSDDELSPAALAARVVLGDCVRELVQSGHWVGAKLTSAV